jgi:hypothetical protein
VAPVPHVLPLAALLSAALAVPAQAATKPGTYRGKTAEGRTVSLHVKAGRLDGVRLVVERYVCDPEGDIGPLYIGMPVGASISRAGRFSFTGGPISERLRMTGRFTGGRVSGRLRVRGTIGQADPCASRWISFSARRGR